MRILVSSTMLFCLFTASTALAQGGNGQLGGIITDPSGALLPGVSITATNPDTGITSTTISNETGSYNFPSLQPGSAYRVSASLPGFQTRTVNNFELRGGTNNRQDFQLAVAATATAIDVQTEANAVITQAGASVGDVLPQARIQSLPIVGNNVLDLLDILPGLRLSPFGSAFD